MKPEDVAAAALAALHHDQQTSPAGINENTAEAEIGTTDNIAKKSKAITNSTEPPAASAGIKEKSTRGRKKAENIKFPTKPRVIQVVKKRRIYMQHSYRDFSSVPPETNFEVSELISEMTFPQKVHHILSQDSYQKWVTWLPHGRAFRVNSAVNFEKTISLDYFGHKRYSSFLRHLSNNDFRHISSGPDRNAYYHEFMLQGLPHLTTYMPEPKNSQRLIPDPDNEPDFYAISSKHPLPDDPDFNMAKPEETSKKPPKKEPAAAPRLASEASWFNDQIPPAKRPTLASNVYNVAAATADQISKASLPLESYADNTLGLAAAASGEKVNKPPILLAGARLSSEGSWFNGQHVQAKPPAFLSMDENVSRLVAAATAAPPSASSTPRVYGDGTTNILSQLQDVINENNKLLLVAALQAGLGGISQPRHQQAPVYDLKDIDAQVQAEAFASMLRSQHTTSYGL